MTSYLLDTNHASPLVTHRHPLRRRVFERLAANDIFAICAPVLTETLFGILGLTRGSANQAEWERIRTSLRCYSVDESDAIEAAMLRLSLRRQGRQLAAIDALIATVALRYDLILLTTDRDFLAVPSLQCENWISAT
jgi:predicted nucleic acid-binding protein